MVKGLAPHHHHPLKKTDGAPGSLLWSGVSLAIVDTWKVNQGITELSPFKK